MSRKRKQKNKRQFSSNKALNSRDGQKDRKSRSPGLVAGVTGNTGYYGEAESGEYLGKLRGQRGRRIFDEMRRSDPQVKAVLSAITLAIRQAEFFVEPASEEKKDLEIAEVIRANLFEEMSLTWDDVIRHVLLMLPFGFSILEKVWEYRDGLFKLRKLDPRLPQSVVRWKYDPSGRHLIGPVQVDTDGREYLLPIEKILVFTSEREGDNWEGISILRAAYKAWYLKNDFEKINAIKHDRHGVGIPKAKVPASVREGTREWQDTENALESLYANEKSYIIEPEGYEFDLLGGSGKAGTDTLGSIRYYDDMIARAMLAMFLNLGTTQTGSRSLGMSFIELFLRSLQAYADYICEVISRFCLREYVDYNWKVAAYPLLKVQPIKELDTDAIGALVSSGLITADLGLENSLRAFFRLPEKPEEDKAAKDPGTERPEDDVSEKKDAPEDENGKPKREESKKKEEEEIPEGEESQEALSAEWRRPPGSSCPPLDDKAANSFVAHSGAFLGAANQLVVPQDAFDATNQLIVPQDAFNTANQPVAPQGAFDTANQFVAPQGAFGAANQPVRPFGRF